MDGGGQRKSRVGQKEREDSGQEGGEKEAVSGRRSTKSATAKTAHCEWCVCVCVRERERERESESEREQERATARERAREREGESAPLALQPRRQTTVLASPLAPDSRSLHALAACASRRMTIKARTQARVRAPRTA
jgi:hypothetical protein